MSPERKFTRLTALQTEALVRERTPLVLDSREANAYAKAHLENAVNLGRHNLDRMLLGSDKIKPVLIYCYHGNASQTYAQMFADFGFMQVYDLIGGYAAWEQHQSTKTAALPTPRIDPVLAEWLADAGFAETGAADPLQARISHQNTPLMKACWTGAADIVERLLDHGVDLEASNGDGNTALWLACVSGDQRIIEALIRAGINLDHQNDNGATCLMYGASASKPQVVAALLEAGADPSIKSLDDFTALDMAASIECLQLLRRATPRSAAQSTAVAAE